MTIGTQLRPQKSVALLEQPRKPMRVLQIVENLNNQSVELWLLRLLRSSVKQDRPVHWTFFCVLGEKGVHDKVARTLGADVIHSRYAVGDKFRFIRSLRDVMKRGAYDILHCHHDVMSAAYLLASKGLPFQKRIVHIHNTSLSVPTPNRLKAGLLREPMRQLCLRMADQIVGVSREALESFVGSGAFDSGRHRVIHCAVDTEKFSRAKIDRNAFRADLGFNRSAKILLFVGRLVDHKNPSFVLEVLEQLAKTDQRAVAVFAGNGDQKAELLELAERKCLSDRIRLLGFRDDVPELMVNSDVLIWPSREETKEGLGMGVVEAQAAGLPVLMSQAVPKEAVVVGGLVDVLSLTAGPKRWSDTVTRILARPRANSGNSAAKLAESSFSLAAGVKSLMSLYETRAR